MSASNLTCPHCMFEAPLYLFDNIDGTKLRCRRCRSTFDDPNTYEPDITYADCDLRKAIYRFPFFMNGKNSIIKVRDGYIAMIVSHDGRERWLNAGDYRITDMTDGFQLYYVCLTPHIIWGTKDITAFGAYGTATLSVSSKYVQTYCNKGGKIISLDDNLKKLVDWCVTTFIRDEIAHGNVALLEQRTRYLNTLGTLTDGVNMIRIDPGGFRNAEGKTGSFPSFSTAAAQIEEEEVHPEIHLPVESIRIPWDGYTVRRGAEDVIITATNRPERHKSGDEVSPNQLQNARKLYRFRTKQFEFPYGWGIYNHPLASKEFFAANGTISFYVDSTEIMSDILKKTDSWKEFEEQLFAGAIKPELSTAIGEILNVYIGTKGVDPSRIRDHLSAMSIDLTNLLNGEGPNGGNPVFKKYGLRVSQLDIMNIELYFDRR